MLDHEQDNPDAESSDAAGEALRSDSAVTELDDEVTGAEDVTEPNAIKPDGIAERLGAHCGDLVILRGLLGPKQEDGSHKLFRSWTFDRWLTIPEDALKAQLPGRFQIDAVSIVWVARDALLQECHCAKACHFAEAAADLDLDPTINPAAGRPKYGGGPR